MHREIKKKKSSTKLNERGEEKRRKCLQTKSYTHQFVVEEMFINLLMILHVLDLSV